jgi:hypothetical protein
VNSAANHCPACGAPGSALVPTVESQRFLALGSHIASKRGAFGSLVPSDSPGGLIHTYASRCAVEKSVGAAVGGVPSPAPFWLHKSPRCGLRSIFEAFTKVFRSVLVLGPEGRAVPPQPLREVSISMPMPVGKPAPISRVYMSAAKSASSMFGFHW